VNARALVALTLAALLTGAATAAPPVSASSGSAAHGKSRKKPGPTQPGIDLDHLPVVAIENSPGLEPFFAALDALADPARAGVPGVVRVLHFGDSHVAADFWTGELRALLQARFGDAGAGYVMPGKPWKYYRHALAKSLPGGWETLGLERDPVNHFLGLSSTALKPKPRSRQAAATTSATGWEVQIGLPQGGGCVQVFVDGEQVFAGELGLDNGLDLPPPEVDPPPKAVAVTRPLPLGPGVGGSAGAPVIGQCQAVAFIRNAEPLPPEPHLLAVEAGCGGAPLVLGMDFSSDRPGVVVDTLGINGAEIERLSRWQPELRGALLEHADPRLIIVSYGANDMTSDLFVNGGYTDLVRDTLLGLRRDAPGAGILVTGPFDRSARRKGARREMVRVNEPALIDAMRSAALETGCAFWDARAAMGGEGAINAWKSAGLAGRDLVHLSQGGYSRLARALYDRLMAAYEEHRENQGAARRAQEGDAAEAAGSGGGAQ
jgi:lysophospholipase L1-like esterase